MAPPTKATTKRLEAAFLAFNSRYADPTQWVEDRWHNSLYAALAQPTKYVGVLNQYAVCDEDGKRILSRNKAETLIPVSVPCLQGANDLEILCYQQTGAETVPFPIPKSLSTAEDTLLTHWNMDAASVLAACALSVRPGDRVLDMCAAPGGKSIVLAQTLFPHLHRSPHHAASGVPQTGCLHVNEFDAARHRKLSANLKAYLPQSLFATPEHPQAPIRILNQDLSVKTSVSVLPHGASGYDKILIDAPCSSERHIVHAYEKAKASGQVADEMLNWKSSHVATLVKTQTGLLRTALRAARMGGTVVYATCALGHEENDGVVERILEGLKTDRKKAKHDGVKVEDWVIQFCMGTEGNAVSESDPILNKMTETTRYGRIALPDHGEWGPLYFSIMMKTEKAKKN